MLPGAASPKPARTVKLGTVSARKAAHPAHLARALAWQSGPPGRTAAVVQDGLCRETTPPARPEGYDEKLSFSHRIFAPSREIRDLGPTSSAHKRRTQEREPWTRDKDAAPSMGLPGEASPQLAWIANRKDADIQEDIRRRVFVRPLCALCSLW
jgi:hypothetical protein